MSGVSCDVCQQGGYKYKCPSCKALSCSLTCFKKHKDELCQSTSESAIPRSEPAITEVKPNINSGDSVLDRSVLVALFDKYPDLRAQLNSIYLSTLDPGGQRNGQEHDRESRNWEDGKVAGNSRSGRYWNSEKGFESGMTLLRSMIETEGLKSEGLRDLMRLTGGG